MRRPWLLIVPALGFLTVMTLFPTVYMVYLSLLNWNLFGGKPSYVGLANFINILSPGSSVLDSLLVTFEFGVIVVAIEFVLGLGTALLIIRQNILAKIAMALLIITLVMPPIVLDMTWKWLYDPTLGPFSYFAILLGTKSPNFLNVMPNAFFSLVAVDVWQWTPFVALILGAGIISLPTPQYEAALIDGASSWRILRDMTLPLLKPVILIVILFRSIDALKVFNKVYFLTAGGPGQATDTLSYHIYYYSIGFTEDVSLGAAISLFFLVIILAISIVLLTSYRRSLKSV